MRTVWDVSTTLDHFPTLRPQPRPSAPARQELLHAVQRMLDEMVRDRRAVVDATPLVAKFNTLLQQVKEQFRGADTLRLIEPLGVDASLALLAVRLSLVKRTLKTELASSTPGEISSKLP